jgi:hypothetical protein
MVCIVRATFNGFDQHVRKLPINEAGPLIHRSSIHNHTTLHHKHEDFQYLMTYICSKLNHIFLQCELRYITNAAETEKPKVTLQVTRDNNRRYFPK